MTLCYRGFQKFSTCDSMKYSQVTWFGANMIESTVRRILGAERVRSVESKELLNDDGAAIVRVQIVYDAERGLSIDEMEAIFDAIWRNRVSDDAPFPVIDFIEDRDLATVAAQ